MDKNLVDVSFDLEPANPSSSSSMHNCNQETAPAAATDDSIRVAPAEFLVDVIGGRFKDARCYARCDRNSIIYYASEEVKKVSQSLNVRKFGLTSHTFKNSDVVGHFYE